MASDVILLDGAAGTCLWEKAENKVAVWRYNLEQPDIVRQLHQEYLAAGSQILLSNTFGANGAAVEKSPYSTREIVAAGVRLAKEAAQGNAQVGLDIGPLTGLLEPYGDIEVEDARVLYQEQIGSGMEEKPDLIFLETFMDVEMLKIALEVANGYDVPVFCSMSFEKVGRTIMGNSVQDMLTALAPYRVAAVGLNCSLGPDSALPILEEFRRLTTLPLLCKPNAGKPQLVNGSMEMEFDIADFVNDLAPAAHLGVRYLGGCCGTSPAYIAALRQRLLG